MGVCPYLTCGYPDRLLDKWTPDKGRVSWRHYDNPHAHVIYHYFYWNTLADMELLRDDDNETLEMDVVFNNVAPESAWSYSYLGDTVGSHWDSNQPVAYRDTQLLDGNDYRPFTVGTAFADQLQPATWYYSGPRKLDTKKAIDKLQSNHEKETLTRP